MRYLVGLMLLCSCVQGTDRFEGEANGNTAQCEGGYCRWMIAGEAPESFYSAKTNTGRWEALGGSGEILDNPYTEAPPYDLPEVGLSQQPLTQDEFHQDTLTTGVPYYSWFWERECHAPNFKTRVICGRPGENTRFVSGYSGPVDHIRFRVDTHYGFKRGTRAKAKFYQWSKGKWRKPLWWNCYPGEECYSKNYVDLPSGRRATIVSTGLYQYVKLEVGDVGLRTALHFSTQTQCTFGKYWLNGHWRCNPAGLGGF